jgi:hypothetical protein
MWLTIISAIIVGLALPCCLMALICFVESVFIGVYNPKEGKNVRKIGVYFSIYVFAAIAYAMVLSHFGLVFV